jgi:hypothetical protein
MVFAGGRRFSRHSHYLQTFPILVYKNEEGTDPALQDLKTILQPAAE